MPLYREQVDQIVGIASRDFPRYLKGLATWRLLAAKTQIERAYWIQAMDINAQFPHVGSKGYWLVNTRRLICQELKTR